MNTNRALLVGYDHTDDKDNTVLVVGERLPGAKVTTIINAFQGVEAKELYEKLVTKIDKTKTVTYKYEVEIGGGCATGSVTVPEGCTDDDIRLAIMDDLYDVSYERVEEE